MPCTHAAHVPLAWPGPPAAPPGPRAPPRPACPPARPSEHLARLVLLQAAEAPHHQALQQQDGQRGGDRQLVAPHQLLHPRARHHLPARDAGRAPGPANRPRACAQARGPEPFHTPPRWAGEGRGPRPHPLVGRAWGSGRSGHFCLQGLSLGALGPFHTSMRVRVWENHLLVAKALSRGAEDLRPDRFGIAGHGGRGTQLAPTPGKC